MLLYHLLLYHLLFRLLNEFAPKGADILVSLDKTHSKRIGGFFTTLLDMYKLNYMYQCPFPAAQGRTVNSLILNTV